MPWAPHPDGRDWRLGMADPKRPEQVLSVLEIKNQAVASASGYGTIFDRIGNYHHIFNPHTGGCASQWAGCTVVAERATIADALSTALLVTPKDQTARVLREGGGARAYLVDEAGRVTIL